MNFNEVPINVQKQNKKDEKMKLKFFDHKHPRHTETGS